MNDLTIENLQNIGYSENDNGLYWNNFFLEGSQKVGLDFLANLLLFINVYV